MLTATNDKASGTLVKESNGQEKVPSIVNKKMEETRSGLTTTIWTELLELL